ncbi:MAG TPA: protein kinase [Anaerolineaceae bacterium]
MDQLVGKSLNRYQIVSLLGEGGMGAVYKGRDITLERDVAIKVMHPHFARQPSFRERFLQEARTAAKLDHPGIVKVHDFGQSENILYIVMEFIPGANLEKILKKLKSENQGIALDEVVKLMVQLCAALDYAHQQGVLHRDIKPGNVMIKPVATEDLPYRVVLTDLGLAKLLEGQGITQEGVSMGTPAYMSPEAAVGEKTDRRSDVYSLGVLLYELAVGRLPFPVKTLTEAVKYHTKEQPEAPRMVRKDLPEELEKVILKAMEKDPSKRYASAGEMGKALGATVGAATQVGKGERESATEVDSGYTGGGTQVSLMTQYEAEGEEERGESLLGEVPVGMATSQDRIQVVSQDHTSRLVNVKVGSMVVGREKDVDIPLEDSKASRRHAKIEFDGKEYRVVDLNSTNGTWLGDAKLLPGVAEVWQADKGLKVGSTWLRLIRAGTVGSAGVESATQREVKGGVGVGTAVGVAKPVASQQGGGKLGVTLGESRLVVVPGASLLVPVTLLNQGTIVEHYKLFVSGIPAGWIMGALPTVQLMPGDKQEVSFTISPPVSPQSKAGRYDLVIRVVSQNTPDLMVEVKAGLTVGVYSKYEMALNPQKVKRGQEAHLVVRNLGNTTEVYTLKWGDRGAELEFDANRNQVQVGEGQTATVGFRVKEKQRKLFGLASSHQFTAEVVTPRGEVKSQIGEYVGYPIIPAWLPPIVVLLCMVVSGIAAVVWGQIRSSNANATLTAVAILTSTARSEADQLATVAFIQTATKEFENANEATQVFLKTAGAQTEAANRTAIASMTSIAQTAAFLDAKDQTNTAIALSTQIAGTQYARETQVKGTEIQGAANNQTATSLVKTQNAVAQQTTQAVPTSTPTSTRTPTRTKTPTPQTVYDFVARACEAQWSSGASPNLPCPNTDNKGGASKLYNTKLENGTNTTLPSLGTHPQWVDYGYIMGTYPSYNLKYSDKFKATIACIYGGGACDVIFNVFIKSGTTTTKVLESREKYDGVVHEIEWLNNMYNGPVNVILQVLANGSSAQDWAVWVNPRIERIGP